MNNGIHDHNNEPQIAPIDHPFLQTQLSYDHTQEFAPPYTRALWEKQHSWIADDINRFKSSQKIRMLDVGCGPAHISESLKDHIDLYVGVDTSLVELKRAKPLPGRFLIHGIGEELDYLPDNSFDAVLFISVLDHVIDWKKTIDARRFGKARRDHAVVMENEDHLVNRLPKLLGRQVEPVDHLHFFTPINRNQTGTRVVSLKAKTFGYGFGLHSLTKKIRVPQPVFKILIPVIDSIGALIAAEGGQVLYGLYQKNADASVQPNSHFLVCPSCKTPIVWGEGTCRQCGSRMPYESNIMDALALLQRSSGAGSVDDVRRLRFFDAGSSLAPGGRLSSLGMHCEKPRGG